MKLRNLVLIVISIVVFGACNNVENTDTSKDDISLKNTPKSEVKEAKNVDMNANEVSKKVSNTALNTEATSTSNNGEVVNLTKQMFIDQIFDYENNPETWVYKGDKPAIIDFYADWCAPCKRIAPIMKELAKKYEGQVNIYKIDTEAERELAAVFGIRSIPSILYIPANAQPVMETGALSKPDYIKRINQYLIK
jgi:thioredoxin